MLERISSLITWTTYGTWLPGDRRGWRKRLGGEQIPRPLLEHWCREQLAGRAVLLSPGDRDTVEAACHEQCNHRGWHLFAVSARTNHVHAVVAADAKPQTVRNQLKANATNRLRRQEHPLVVKHTWTRLGDCSILRNLDDIEQAILYVTDAQDRKVLELDG